MPFNMLDNSTKELLARLCGQDGQKSNDKKNQDSSSDKKSGLPNLSPSQVLVIAGILGGVLEVNSVLIDRAQEVQIILVGSFKQKDGNDSNELENMLDQIGNKSFDEVVKAMINRLK